jgi:hypothetical protein
MSKYQFNRSISYQVKSTDRENLSHILGALIWNKTYKIKENKVSVTHIKQAVELHYWQFIKVV